MNPRKLILASASPRRVELLRSLPVNFDVLPSQAEELHDPALSAAELCVINARRKAEEVAGTNRDRIVLGADTLVTLDAALFGKPRDFAEAFMMLAKLSGRTHQVITGVCLLRYQDHRSEVFIDETLVTFKPLPPETIRAYLELVPVLDKAGAYGIQERGEMLIEKIEGSLSNVVGLPLEKLAQALVRWGIISPPEPDKSVGHPSSTGPRT